MVGKVKDIIYHVHVVLHPERQRMGILHGAKAVTPLHLAEGVWHSFAVLALLL